MNKGKPNERFIKAEEVSAEILKKLKSTAEVNNDDFIVEAKEIFVQKYLNKQVTGAVVTVPALFNSDQISAIKRAVELAGLELKYLLHEPIAAAIAYYNEMRITDSTIMVFDFGGG